MKLVGICGAIGSGKSTFAELLTAVDPAHSLHMETSGLIIELANTFNATLDEHFEDLNHTDNLIPLCNTLIEALIPQLSAMAGQKLDIDQLGIDPEDALVHPEWYEKLFVYLSQAQQLPSMLREEVSAANKNNYRPLLQWIGGYFLYKLNNRLLWYEELLKRAHAAGSAIQLVIVTAPRQPSEAEFVQAEGGKVLKIVRKGLISDNTDVTERPVDDIEPDIIVNNDGSLEDLQKTAEKLHYDLLDDGVKPKYSAKQVAH